MSNYASRRPRGTATYKELLHAALDTKLNVMSGLLSSGKCSTYLVVTCDGPSFPLTDRRRLPLPREGETPVPFFESKENAHFDRRLGGYVAPSLEDSGMKLKERNHKIKERGKKREKEYLMKKCGCTYRYTDKERRKKTTRNRIGIRRRGTK